MYLLFISLYVVGRNVFDAGKSITIYNSHWKGWALKTETFLGPEMATSKGNVLWAQKSWVMGPSNGFSPIKIIKYERQIKKQVHC